MSLVNEQKSADGVKSAEKIKIFWVRSQANQQVHEYFEAVSHLEAVGNGFGVEKNRLKESNPFKFDFVSEVLTDDGNLERCYWVVNESKI